MQFIDKVKLKLKAGNGGNGIVAFKREKYNPLGGPSGGDGGNGGSIIFKVDTNKSTLLDLRFSKMIRAQDGENGKGNNMYGASRDDVIVKVPLGTIVKDLDLDEVIASPRDRNAVSTSRISFCISEAAFCIAMISSSSFFGSIRANSGTACPSTVPGLYAPNSFKLS